MIRIKIIIIMNEYSNQYHNNVELITSKMMHIIIYLSNNHMEYLHSRNKKIWNTETDFFLF